MLNGYHNCDWLGSSSDTDRDRCTTVSRVLHLFFSVFSWSWSSGSRRLLSNGSGYLVLTPPPDAAQAIQGDCFSENRVGLDHVSLNVVRRADLETAVRLFADQGVAHGEIKDLGADLGLYVLAFRDPDNIQLELTAPYA